MPVLPNGVPYSGGSTSLAAAVSINAVALRAQVLAEIQRYGPVGRTADEIEAAFKMRHQTATPRCWELKGTGHIVMTSMKRRTRSGRQARVYIASGVPLPPGVYVVHSRSEPVAPQFVVRDAWVEGEYRYTLTRQWGPGPILLWILANPSTADAADEDQTSLKMRGFARRLGFGGYVAVNLGAWRSTDPKQMLAALKTGADVIGPKNDETIRYLAYNLRFVVCAWGDCLGSWGEKRGAEVKSMLTSMGITPCHLGLTEAGNPRHPLRVAYATKLEQWT